MPRPPHDPQDGVYPEKVNKGRAPANVNLRSIGKNVNPADIKFTGKLGERARPALGCMQASRAVVGPLGRPCRRGLTALGYLQPLTRRRLCRPVRCVSAFREGGGEGRRRFDGPRSQV